MFESFIWILGTYVVQVIFLTLIIIDNTRDIT